MPLLQLETVSTQGFVPLLASNMLQCDRHGSQKSVAERPHVFSQKRRTEHQPSTSFTTYASERHAQLRASI